MPSYGRDMSSFIDFFKAVSVLWLFSYVVKCYLDYLDIQQNITLAHYIYGIMPAGADEQESTNIPDT